MARNLPQLAVRAWPAFGVDTGPRRAHAARVIDLVGLRGLYAILDPEHCGGRDPLQVARAVLRGGCALLQLRAKRMQGGERAALGRELRALCEQQGTPFVVNDDLELALALGADGVHLGQGDLPLERARERAGARLQIGLSTHGLEQARAAQRRGADLIGFGPVFPTETKVDPDPVVGIEGLRAACAAVSIPVVAIGGLTLARAPEVRAAGPALGAVISAVCRASDPERAARELHAALGGAPR
jgi:thiamine-phosphate pyrophosphorylase